MNKINLTLCSIIFMLSGCGETDSVLEMNLESKEAKITVELSKVVKSKNDDSSLVYGSFKLIPLLPVRNYVDLSCFQLKIENEVSSKIYIDSVASFNSERMLLNQDGKLEYKVYWNIDKRVETEELKNFSLIQIRENCLH
ncbi:hypothetical protein [Alteromonas stellipolaris]|uniref:hypothetical protein n=1 Tax=Alteromonas stellipolaris TaxID=233316 RepID=UPI000A4203CC|nr:hypothetical protein [Alteromonas stellipolaris]